MLPMPMATQMRLPAEGLARVRRGYFECRYGQLHVHNVMPPGGGFEEDMPLMCVHDPAGSGRTFTSFLAVAGQNRSVYAPDLPGFGESDGPASPPAIADYAAALGDFLDSVRLRQVAVLGLRGGALLATELALMRPLQVSRVIMVSPLLTETERTAPTQAAPPAGSDGAFRPAHWLRWAQEAAARYPLRERLPKLTQPLLVLRPRDDLWGPTVRVREALPTARFTDLEQSATEVFAYAPQRVADAVREFLR